MKKMLRKFIQWVMVDKERERERERDIFAPVVSADEAVQKAQPKVRIGMVDAMNGKILEVATYKRNNHGPDWTSEYFIIDSATPLNEQIATVMVMKGLSV